jgi:outer membrane receptor protein involved in Fe transport
MQSRFTILSIVAVAALSISISGRVSAQQQETPPTTNPPTQSGAQAQPQAPEPQTGSPAAAEPVTDAGKKSATEEIVVTGSRIRRKDLTTPAPVTVISREQVTQSGKVSIGDFLQTLPEQGNAINTNVNNGGDGSTRVSLRGLGSPRTLVLVNGRRFVPGGTGADSSVDLNSIPTASIERIEVLKDGASAVYGSDAIGGVVNLITRKGFKGTEVAGTAGLSSQGDGATYDINATTGQAGDRGNVVFSGGYFQQKPVWAGNRSFAAVPVFYDASQDPTGSTCNSDPSQCLYTAGSGTIPQGRIIIPKAERGVKNGNSIWNQLMVLYPKASALIHCNNDGSDPACNALGWRQYRGAFLTAQDNALGGLPPGSPVGDGYNYQPQNYLVTPAQRISLYSIGDLSLGSNSRGYYEASYVNRQSEQRLAPEPLLTDGEGVTVSQYSIYNPFGRDFGAVRRRLLEFGNRVFNEDIDTFRVVGGLDGTLPEETGPLKGWFWDMSLNYGRTEQAGTKHGNLRNPKIQDAIGPSARDRNGQPVCLSAASTPPPGTIVAVDDPSIIPGCVPLNLLGGAGTIGADQATPLSYTGVDRGINQMTALQFNTSGELFTLAADRPVSIAAGYEYRLLYGSAIPDPITVAGETTGNKGLITRGGYHVNEGYAELSVPVISNITGAEALELTGAARVFNYSTFGTDWTYKGGARWRIIHDLTVRGTYSTAFRAPSIGDLYGGQSDNFAPVKDPCRGTSVPGAPPAPASCGIAADNGDDQSQLRSRVGGNPDLRPETAKIYTVGVVIEPSIVKNFSVTVDYYHFDLSQTLSNLGESVILQGCYPTSASVAPKYCNLIVRDPATHRINQIFNLNQNVGSTTTDGLDLAMRYALPTEFGRFGAILDATFLNKYDVTLANGDVIHAKGTFDANNAGTGGTYPSWKFNAGATWSMAGANAGVTWRFIGAFKECGDGGGDFSGSGLCYKDDTYQRRVEPYNAVDLHLGYALNTGFGRTQFSVGVNNVADRKPAKIYNGFIAGTDVYNYDVMGRFVYGRIAQTF